SALCPYTTLFRSRGWRGRRGSRRSALPVVLDDLVEDVDRVQLLVDLLLKPATVLAQHLDQGVGAVLGTHEAGEHGLDLSAREAGGEEALDQQHLVHGARGVAAVARGGALRREQALLLVVAQGAMADASARGELTDAQR